MFLKNIKNKSKKFIITPFKVRILTGGVFMKVKELMTKSVATLNENDTVEQAAHLMKEHNIGSLPICQGEKALKLDENIEKNGFVIMLLMRLSIVFPFDPLCYASGLTKIKYRDFILGTMLGILPEMTVYSFMGKNISHPFSLRFILPILSVMLLAIISYYVSKKYKKQA